MDKNNPTSFCLQPFSDLKGYMAIKNGQDKSKYSLQELLKVIQDSFKIVDEIKNMIWSQNRRGNSGVSWDHSSQKIFDIPQKILHCDLKIPEGQELYVVVISLGKNHIFSIQCPGLVQEYCRNLDLDSFLI